jgi:hypothetical protein
MSELYRVPSDSSTSALFDVVFVHGLGGDMRKTWEADRTEKTYWPAWLAAELPAAAVYSLGYDASPSAWLGHAMPLVDRAKNVLARLEANGFGARPVVFVCHSLGGLLVKQLLMTGETLGDPNWQKVARATRAVLFLATPHSGSRLADYLNLLGKLARATVAIDDLRANEPHLRDLSTWYSNNAARLGIETRAYFETRDTKGLRVVDESSANPGISGVVPIAVDADHAEICKPANGDSLVYKHVRQFLNGIQPATATRPSPIDSRPTSQAADGRAWRYFLSYRRSAQADARLAGFLADGLRAAGCEVFIDIDMPVGIVWSEEIERRIAWSDYLVVLLSEDSVASEMVQGEVRCAHQAGKPGKKSKVLPVRVAYQGPLGYEMDSYIGKLQYVLWRNEVDDRATLGALLNAPSGLAESSQPDLQPESVSTAPGRPEPKADMRLLRESLETPGSRLAIETPFYVRRVADDRVETLARKKSRQLLVIKGANQTGKSSLLLRYLAKSHESGKRVALIDLIGLGDVKRMAFPAFARQFAQALAGKLRLRHIEFPEMVNAMELTYFVEDQVFPRIEGGLVVAIDELDRVIGSDWQEDFFSTLRSWDSNGSDFTLKGSWGRLSLALALATDPRMLIESGYTSPFNAADPIILGPFPRPALDTFNARYGCLLGPQELDRLHALLRGHPYLTPLAFYRLACEERPDFQGMVDAAADEHGPFSDHLRSMFDRLRNAHLLDPLGQILRTHDLPDRGLYYRLEAAGLVREEQGTLVAGNELYERFFRAVL